MADEAATDDRLERAPCGFFAFSDDGSIVAANATLGEWLGYGPGALEGRHVEFLLSGGGRVFYQTHLFPLLRLHGRADEIYLSLRPREGVELPVLANAVRRERAGAFVNECVVLPMRRRSRYEDEILVAKRTAEQATREKSHAYDALERAQAELAEQQQELLEANARLRAQSEREALLNRIGQTIRAATAPQQVLEVAVRALGLALGADRCYFAAYDGETVTAGPDWHRDGLRSIAGRCPLSAFAMNRDPAYRAGRTQVLPDNAGDAAAQALGLRALVRVPLTRVPLVSGSAMTALSVAMAGGPRQWTPEEVGLVEAVATQTQTALESVRVQRREHAIAQQLQEALLPAVPETVPGLALGHFTEPALDEAAVGGDFYDVFPLDKDLYAVVIGDVSGKGLAAAQQLALVRNGLRTTLYLDRAPARAAAALNRIVTAHDLLAGFVTCWVGAYDAATGRIGYCSCGHEPGLVRRADGRVEELETTGPPLGAAENAPYGELSVRLSAGDALLLYTDGLSEAGPSRTDMLGTGGLARLLAGLPAGLGAQAQARALVGQVGAFAGGAFRDDVAVLLARRQ